MIKMNIIFFILLKKCLLSHLKFFCNSTSYLESLQQRLLRPDRSINIRLRGAEHLLAVMKRLPEVLHVEVLLLERVPHVLVLALQNIGGCLHGLQLQPQVLDNVPLVVKLPREIASYCACAVHYVQLDIITIIILCLVNRKLLSITQCCSC